MKVFLKIVVLLLAALCLFGCAAQSNTTDKDSRSEKDDSKTESAVSEHSDILFLSKKGAIMC